MENVLTRWMHRHKREEKKSEEKRVTIDDVVPLHPDDYPGQQLRERLAHRREELNEIDDRGHPTGMPEGPDGF